MPIEGYNLSVKMRTGFIPLDIQDARTFGSTSGESWGNATAAIGTPGGGVLSSATAPRLTALSTTNRAMVADWSSGSAVQIQFPPVILPPDFSSVSSATINLITGRAAALSSDTAPAWNVSIYTAGGSSVAAINLPVTAASSAATTLSAAISTVQIAVGYPSILTVAIAPASSQDNLKLYGAWIEYTRIQRG